MAAAAPAAAAATTDSGDDVTLSGRKRLRGRPPRVASPALVDGDAAAIAAAAASGPVSGSPAAAGGRPGRLRRAAAIAAAAALDGDSAGRDDEPSEAAAAEPMEAEPAELVRTSALEPAAALAPAPANDSVAGDPEADRGHARDAEDVVEEDLIGDILFVSSADGVDDTAAAAAADAASPAGASPPLPRGRGSTRSLGTVGEEVRGRPRGRPPRSGVHAFSKSLALPTAYDVDLNAFRRPAASPPELPASAYSGRGRPRGAAPGVRALRRCTAL